MEIKGTSVKITNDFVKLKYPNNYKDWINAMPIPSQKVFNEIIRSVDWYNLMDSVIIPTQVLSKLVYNADAKKMAWEIGKYSAKAALTGIYKAFFLVTTTRYVLERARNVWGTYYRPCEFTSVESQSNRAVFKIDGFKAEEALIFQRFGGWIEGLFELTRQTNKGIEVKIIPNGKFITAMITAQWA